MKRFVPIAIALLLLGGAALLVRNNFIVIDGAVTWWQVEPVVARGAIENDREYRAVLYYVEQIFARGGFERPDELDIVEKLNALLAAYHESKQDAHDSAQGGA